MGIELEEEVREINEDEDDRGTAAELEEIRGFESAIDSTVQPLMECGGDDQGNDRDCHEGRI